MIYKCPCCHREIEYESDIIMIRCGCGYTQDIKEEQKDGTKTTTNT